MLVQNVEIIKKKNKSIIYQICEKGIFRCSGTFLSFFHISKRYMIVAVLTKSFEPSARSPVIKETI